MPAVPKDDAPPSRILIRAPNWVGDVVMATSSFADVRRSFPAAHITVLLLPGREKVIDGSSDHDRIIFDRSGRDIRGLARLASGLRRERFDLAVIFPASFRSALACFLAGIPRRVGYRRNMRGILLTDPVDYEVDGGRRRPIPMPRLYARLCARAGVAEGDGRPRLQVTPACEEKAREFRKAAGIGDEEALVGINPGASFGASKLWPPARFAEVADAITARYGVRTIIFVGPGEDSIAEEILARARTRPIHDPAQRVGLDLLKPLVRDLKLLVTTDTGPRHYAAAFGVPAVVVMGPTHPGHTAMNLEKAEVVRHDVPCGPCHLKTCPIDHRCMEGITAAEVLHRVAELDRRLGLFARPLL
jgi:heptosyltransferase-2